MGDRVIINRKFADFKVDFYFVSLFIKKPFPSTRKGWGGRRELSLFLRIHEKAGVFSSWLYL
jgi:hypothetical protein